MTRAEAQAMLGRSDARQLRLNAGFSLITVARAFDVTPEQVARWESGRYLPCCPTGYRWIRFTEALERRAAFRAGENSLPGSRTTVPLTPLFASLTVQVNGAR